MKPRLSLLAVCALALFISLLFTNPASAQLLKPKKPVATETKEAEKPAVEEPAKNEQVEPEQENIDKLGEKLEKGEDISPNDISKIFTPGLLKKATSFITDIQKSVKEDSADWMKMPLGDELYFRRFKYTTPEGLKQDIYDVKDKDGEINRRITTYYETGEVCMSRDQFNIKELPPEQR